MRSLSWIGTALYLLALIVLLPVMEWWGERNWLISLLLFAPPWLLLLPLGVLVPLALFAKTYRASLAHAAAVIAVLFVFMTFSFSSQRTSPRAVTVVTYNAGQGDQKRFAEFVRENDPDLILLQDARTRGPSYTRMFPDRYVASRGEFVVVSKHLIQQGRLMEKPLWRKRPVASRFEVVINGRPVAVYNVHLPTPRQQLSRFLGPGIVADLLPEEQGVAYATYREWLQARVTLARELSAAIAEEQLPYFAAGDFNMPDHGQIYHLFADKLTDAFGAAGRGWGLTFPGRSRNPASLFGPWLRIDYVFSGPGWKPIACSVDPVRTSQHRPVLARLDPID